MLTILILRRDPLAVRRTLASIEATRDMRVVGVVSTLEAARRQILRLNPAVLLTDLSLDDGAAISLLVEMRRQAAERDWPKVMLIAPSAADVLLFGSVSAGADSFVVEAPGAPSLPAALRGMMQGEAAMTPSLARQVLGFFGSSSKASSGINERRLDWLQGASDPLQLSRGEQHLLALLSQGESLGSVAVRFALSIESVGRRISNVYRKLQWDLRSGALSLHTA